MPVFTFIGLLVALSFGFLLSHMWHMRKVRAQIEQATADAKEILNCSAEGIITSDSNGTITSFNLAAENIFAYKALNIIGKSFLTLLPEETRKAHANIMSGGKKSQTDQAFQSYELMARQSDGSAFPLAMTVSMINEQGGPVNLCMCRDISARKIAEVNSQKSQRMMEFLLGSSPVVFYRCNIQGNFPIVFISPNVEKLFGYKPEAVTGATAFWPRHIHPDDIDQVHSSGFSKLKSDHQKLEYRLKLADGSYRWIADDRTIVNDDSGKPNMFVGCWTDIHDRKVAETSLASKQEHLRISLKCANLTTWEWNINSGKITWFGNVSQKLGLESERLTDFDQFIALAHAEDSVALQDEFKRCLVQDQDLDHEYRIVGPDKSIHWIRLAGELINDETGNPVRMAGVLSDISTEKRMRIAPAIAVKRAG